METNRILVSRIHWLANELNQICDVPDLDDFDSRAASLVQQVDDMGYRILSVHSLTEEELIQLPTNSPEQVNSAHEYLRKLNDPEMERQDVYDLRAELRQLERELISQYCLDIEQPWFRILPHAFRLLVYNEAPGHPMNQHAESFRTHGLLELRTEYEGLLWGYQQFRQTHDANQDITRYLFEQRASDLFRLHLRMLMVCMRRKNAGDVNIAMNGLLQTLNTMLLQVAEMNDPRYFREHMFWCMCDRVKWHLGRK